MTSLNESSLWRTNLTNQARLAAPLPEAPSIQPNSSNLWQTLTPWKEEQGETFGDALAAFAKWGTPYDVKNTATPRASGGNTIKTWSDFFADLNNKSYKPFGFVEPVLTGASIPLAGPAAAGIKALAPTAAKQGAKGAAASVARGGLANVGGSARAVFAESGALARGGTNVAANRATQAIAAVPAALETGIGKVGALVGGGVAAKGLLDIKISPMRDNITDIVVNRADGYKAEVSLSHFKADPTTGHIGFFKEGGYITTTGAPAPNLTTAELKQLWLKVGQTAKERGYTKLVIDTADPRHVKLYDSLGLTKIEPQIKNRSIGDAQATTYHLTPDEMIAKAIDMRAPYNKSLSLRGAMQAENLIPLEQRMGEVLNAPPVTPPTGTLALPGKPPAIEGEFIRHPKAKPTGVRAPATLDEVVRNNPLKFTKARKKMHKTLNGLVREGVITDKELQQLHQTEDLLANAMVNDPAHAAEAAQLYAKMLTDVDNTVMHRMAAQTGAQAGAAGTAGASGVGGAAGGGGRGAGGVDGAAWVTPPPPGTPASSFVPSGKFQPIDFRLTDNDVLAADLFRNDIRRRIALWSYGQAEKRGGIAGVGAKALAQAVKAIGGVASEIKVVPGSKVDKALRSIGVRAYQLANRQNIVSLMRPMLLKYGSPQKLFNMDKVGHVGADILTPLTPGDSVAIYDVLENPGKYFWKNQAAKEYAEEARNIVRSIQETAKKEGIQIPDDVMFHRVVIGKTGKKSGVFEESEFGSSMLKERFYTTMEEGIQDGMTYGINPNDSVDDVVGYYLKAIYEKRFRNEIGKLVVRKGRGQNPHLGEFEATAHSIDPSKPVLHPAFSGPHGGVLIFDKDVMKVVHREMTDKGQKWLQTARDISGLGRIITASMDFSAPFLQGLAVLGKNPALWAKATWQHYSFAGDPKRLVQWMNLKDIAAARADFVANGGNASVFEYYDALKPIQRGLERFGTKGKIQGNIAKVTGSAIQNTFGRAESAFTGFGEVARIGLWKSLKRPNMTTTELRDLATTINRMTGAMSTESLGLGLSQRQVEDAVMFFAPRYTRAGLSLFVNAISSGGLSGKLARESLVGLAAAGTVMYMGVTSALGQEAKLDPNKADFMTVEVGGHRIGIGGIQTAIMRLGADVVATTQENPQDLVLPFKAGNLNRWDNPFVKFWYNRSSPLFGTVYGAAVENKTFFGEDLDDLQSWAKFISEKTTPIALQSLTPSNGVDATIPSFSANILGLREYVPKPTDPVTAVADNTWAQYPKQLRSISDEIVKLEKENPLAARQLLYKYPLIVQIRKQIAAAQLREKAKQKLASA